MLTCKVCHKRQTHALLDNFFSKSNLIDNSDVGNTILPRKISIYTSVFFSFKKV